MDINAVQCQVSRVILSKHWYTGRCKNYSPVTGRLSKKDRKNMYLRSLGYLKRVLIENWNFLTTYHFGH